ncbi:hypothetical protein MAH1_35180 [Sessilibacter sp. MAH1]
MKSITIKDEPKWAVNVDDRKYKHISRIVKNFLIPKYSEYPMWSEFYDYLGSSRNFTHSNHYYRYLNTFGLLVSQLGVLKNRVILETGGASPISTFLSHYNECFSTESDLRLEFDVPDNYVDVVLSFEVLEHIKDQPETNISQVVLFQESGVKCFVSEIKRVLKEGGEVVLTTPNACSYRAILEAVEHRPPTIFRPHVREYSKNEILSFFNEFKCKYYTSTNNFFMLGDDVNKFEKKFKKAGWSIDDRGDDHLFYFNC